MKNLITLFTLLISFQTIATEIVIEKYSNDPVSLKEQEALSKVITNKPTTSNELATAINSLNNVRHIELNGIPLNTFELQRNLENNLMRNFAREGIGNGSGSGGGGG